jgi:predicted O-linked N-acetylglucosamine transferase (SPINDLY family)
MRLYDFKLFEYEKRHINNVRSLKSIIAKNFNNCLNHTQNILFIVNKSEEEYYYKWLASELRIDSNKIEILKHNIKFYNDMFKDMKGLRKNKKLNFLVT